jgi:hypothetical protein
MMTPSSEQQEPRPSTAPTWRILGLVGMGLIVAGAADLGSGLYPLAFGTPEWEFGSIASFLNRLPLMALGLALALAASLALRSRATSILWATGLLGVGLLVLLLGLVFVTAVPVVMTGQPGDVRVQLWKGIAKAGAQAVVYTLAFVGTAIYAIRAGLRFKGA